MSTIDELRRAFMVDPAEAEAERPPVKLADVSRPRPVPGDGSTTHPCAMCPLDGETPEDCERCPVREEGASHPGRSGA